ncbi:MAG: DUF3160 domain-containing protein, partial [Synergistaceae bacterium]|nr:DUF3160 domain-containing protein [Synergistaceae bacterium]
MRSRARVFVPIFLILAAFLPTTAAAAEYYIVLDEVLPIMTSPGAKYEVSDGVVEWSDDVDGIVVYGNRLNLRPSETEGWSGLLSPEDGSTLGYVETKGMEKFPEYAETETKYYMALKDAPELSLIPGKDKKYQLSSYGYSLLKGEVVPSRGEREGMLLLTFGTDFETGDGGVGERCAWGRMEDFIALEVYSPDNGRLDPQSIPSGMRREIVRESGKTDDGVVKITTGLLERISRRGFVIEPDPVLREYILVDDMADSYRETLDYEVDFVTTDIFLHSFHLIFDHTLQTLELTYLAPALETGLKNAASDLENIKGDIPSDALPSWETARDMFSVARDLLAEKSDASISDRAAGELRLILAAEGMEESGVTGQKIDYSIFKPRGHYTLTPEFQRYFRSMSYIGTAELPLFDAAQRPISRNV